jgi:hypothetical protein
MKILFDFDGVFVPDFDRIPILDGLSEFYDMLYYARPIFKPAGRWGILTGRDPLYRSVTEKYVDRHFENKPLQIFHERRMGEQKPWEYKLEVLTNNPSIMFFIESDPHTVDYLKEHLTTKCFVHLFSQLPQSLYEKGL